MLCCSKWHLVFKKSRDPQFWNCDKECWCLLINVLQWISRPCGAALIEIQTYINRSQNDIIVVSHLCCNGFVVLSYFGCFILRSDKFFFGRSSWAIISYKPKCFHAAFTLNNRNVHWNLIRLIRCGLKRYHQSINVNVILEQKSRSLC